MRLQGLLGHGAIQKQHQPAVGMPVEVLTRVRALLHHPVGRFAFPQRVQGGLGQNDYLDSNNVSGIAFATAAYPASLGWR